MTKKNGYKLSRTIFNFSFENPDKIKTIHIALYYYITELNNKLGWVEKFGIPSDIAMLSIGVKSKNTYLKALNDLVEFGLIKMIKKSSNQFTSSIIAISNIDTPQYTAYDTATIQQMVRQLYGTDTISKQLNNKEEEDPPTQKEVINYFNEKGYTDDQAIRAFSQVYCFY